MTFIDKYTALNALHKEFNKDIHDSSWCEGYQTAINVLKSINCVKLEIKASDDNIKNK